MGEVVKDEDEELKVVKRESMNQLRELIVQNQKNDNVLRMNQSVSVKFHKMNLF